MPRSYITKAPLFDQLTEKSEFLNGPSGVPILLDEEGLKASVYKELSALLNSRNSFSPSRIDQLLESVDNEKQIAGIEGMMGLPELRDAFAEGAAGASDFAEACARTLRLYEPRLKNPVVHIDGFDTHHQRLKLIIKGELVLGPRRENVTFSVAITPQENTERPLESLAFAPASKG